MLNYLINSLKRKIARRVTKKHPTRVDTFLLPGVGEIKFANWENPLVENKILSAETLGFFQKFLSDGDFAIDIGANIGHTTLQMALATGKTGLTLGFDPNPYVFDILTENAGLNPGKAAMAVYNLAITDHDDEFYYNSSEASFNNGGISSEPLNKHGKYALSQKVKGVNLESFLEKKYSAFLSKLKLIKIDTEGYDKEIIKSISNLLDKYQPIIITECFGGNTLNEKFEQYNLLVNKGYELYYVSDFVATAETVRLTCKEDMLKWKHFDLYALPNTNR